MDNKDRATWFRKLYQRYYRPIVAYFVRSGFPLEEARQLAQDAFLRVYQGMDSYEGRGDFAFLKTTATRVALNAVRAQHADKRRVEIVSVEDLPVPESPPIASSPGMSEPQPSAEESLIEQEEVELRRQWLQEAIAGLPEGLRQCVLLRVRGVSYREIARLLGISEDAVKSRLHEALKKLREAAQRGPQARRRNEHGR